MSIAKRQTGADHITHMPALCLKLEDGKEHNFKWSTEVAVPDDHLGQRREYQRVPAQIAFWAYQAERALREVRDLERQVAHKEGEMNLVYRRWYTERDEVYTEGQIRSRVDTDGEVGSLKDELNGARGMYGTLRALRDAVEHRAFVLRQLVNLPLGPST